MVDFNEENYKKAQAFDGEVVRLPAGGYICKILFEWLPVGND